MAALAATAALAAGPSAPPDKPYIVITRDGHRIDAMEKPVIEGTHAKVRLAPRGNLALVPADSIDWPATEKYNAPPPASARKPAEERSPAGSGAAHPSAAEGSGVRELKILGSRHGLVVTAGKPGEGGEVGLLGIQPASAAAEPRPSQDPNQSAVQLATLSREMDGLKKILQEMNDSKAKQEEEIAKLQEQVSKQPPASGVQQYESPAQRALDRAHEALKQVEDQIAKIESRMSEIRSQAVQLGGAVY
jgi:archaellum component FlaC